MYAVAMLKRTNVYLDTKTLKQLEALGRPQGLKTAQVIRMALAEYIARKKRG